MKDFLRAFLVEPFEDKDFLSSFVGVCCWILFIPIVAGVLWLSMWLIDSSFLPIKNGGGAVTEKYYVPAHTTTTLQACGKSFIPITTYYDESFEIQITINELSDKIELYQSDWNNIIIGQKINCEYTNGRILNSLYIKSFQTIKN